MSDKDYVVEEVVIVEECDGEDDGEWELGEDGCWYCVVDEYYEEEMLSPGGSNSTIVNSKTHQLNLSKPGGRPSPRKSLIGRSRGDSSPATPQPKQVPTKLKETIPPPERKLTIGSNRQGQVKKENYQTPISKPKSSTSDSSNKVEVKNSPPKKGSKGHRRRKSLDRKAEKSLLPSRDSKTKDSKDKDLKTKGSKQESPEKPSGTQCSKRYGGVGALKMSSAMRSSPSGIIAAHKRDMINSAAIPDAVITQSRITTKERTEGKSLKRGASSSSVASKKISRRPSLIDESNPDIVFGAPLDTVIERQHVKGLNDDVPTIVEWTVEHIRINGMSTNGIFRQSGHHGKQLEKQQLIDQACSKRELGLVRIFSLDYYVYQLTVR